MQALARLVQHTACAAGAEEIEARELANVVYGVAQSGMGVCLGMMFAALGRVAEQRLGECNAQNLANTAWAFVMVNLSDELLFAALARVAACPVGKFNVQELANTAWVLAMVDLPD